MISKLYYLGAIGHAFRFQNGQIEQDLKNNFKKKHEYEKQPSLNLFVTINYE